MEAHDGGAGKTGSHDAGGARPATTEIGPLGSTVHVLHADAGTVAALAAIDWNERFRRVWLDAAAGLVVLMAPSRLHEDLTRILDQVVDAAASVMTGAATGLRQSRLRAEDDPPGTGMEADCAYYVGERARAYQTALVEGEAAADAFFDRTPPDLVVETEITHGAKAKIERCRDLGVRELWRLHGRKGTRKLRVEFLALHAGRPPRELAASRLLAGLTADDIRAAVDGVRAGLTNEERAAAVTRIVRRRRDTIRVREEGAPAWGTA